MKLKTYAIYIAGSEKVDTIRTTCITKAVKQFIETLDQPAKYELSDKCSATIRYNENRSIMNDFVVMEA